MLVNLSSMDILVTIPPKYWLTELSGLFHVGARILVSLDLAHRESFIPLGWCCLCGD